MIKNKVDAISAESEAMQYQKPLLRVMHGSPRKGMHGMN